MIGSEQHFRDSFGAKRAGVLLDALSKAASRAHRLAVHEGFIERRTEPTVAFDLATHALDGRFGLEPGVRRAVVKGQNLWVIDDSYAIRVKKLKTGYKPSNHDSKQQTAIAAQLPLEDLPPLVYVTAGTRYSDLTGLAAEFVVVKHYPDFRGKQIVEWVVDLQELAAGGVGAIVPTLPLAPAAPSASVVSRRRPEAGKDISEEA
jgi:hypothetical protein